MKKWGLVVAALYSVIVIALCLPGFLALAEEHGIFSSTFQSDLASLFRWAIAWIPLGILLAAQAVLLFLSVDTSEKRLKPRAHVALSWIAGSGFVALMAAGGFWSVYAAIRGDASANSVGIWGAILAIVIAWTVWGVLFFSSGKIPGLAQVLKWLLAGSILELLIAVPCHVIVRRRHDCSAPIATGFGIVTGVAVMLLSFGPGVLLLYKRRLASYHRGESPRPWSERTSRTNPHN